MRGHHSIFKNVAFFAGWAGAGLAGWLGWLAGLLAGWPAWEYQNPGGGNVDIFMLLATFLKIE